MKTLKVSSRHEKDILLLYIFYLLIGIVKFFSFATTDLTNDESYMNYFNSKYSIFALPKPITQLNFCGERVPLEDPEIWERYDKELLKNTYWQSNTLLLHKRAHKYFPIIEPILKNTSPYRFQIPRADRKRFRKCNLTSRRYRFLANNERNC